MIDAHQHFWKFDPVRDSWITDEMKIIRRDFLPADLEPVLKDNGIQGTVLVQAAESLDETRFLIEEARQNDFVRAVVGWEDLTANDLEERLKEWNAFPKLKGFRAVMQGKPDEQYLANRQFQEGVNLLEKFGYSYDLLIYHDQFPSAIRFVEKFPDHRFILDHLGKPAIRDREYRRWKENMRILSQHPGIYCKCSGLITEADWNKWEEKDLFPYLEITAEYFGTDRICFGSDWPVCLVAGKYEEVLNLVKNFFSQVNPSEQKKIFGENAGRFYRIT